MSKRNKKINDYRQLSLFDLIKQEQTRQEEQHQEGNLDVNAKFRAAVSESLKRSPLSRAQVAAEMSDLTGTEITLSMLNCWTAESKEQHRFPAIFLPALYQVTKSDWLYRVLMKPIGLYVMESPEALKSELADVDLRIKKLQKERREHLALLKRMER